MDYNGMENIFCMNIYVYEHFITVFAMLAYEHLAAFLLTIC